MKKGNLYLIPTVIAANTEDHVIPNHVMEAIKGLDYFLVENVRSARRYISQLSLGLDISSLKFEVLDKRTTPQAVASLMTPALKGQDIGIISESGCPGIADPGSVAVQYAHTHGIRVMPLVGPSSILMALMASGFNGQSFIFHGYVPIEKKDRARKIKSMESAAQQLRQTQLFMDTPYRNQKLLADLLTHCHSDTKLSIARDITGKDEFIVTKTIAQWKTSRPELNKMPAIFSLFV